jgi:hypothetical protein
LEQGIKQKQQHTDGAMIKTSMVKIAVKEEMPQEHSTQDLRRGGAQEMTVPYPYLKPSHTEGEATQGV